jgi:CubicO group peptidase (beta-lactamase class C family)
MHPPGAAGGLVSNVLDLAKWHLALEEGRLLPPDLYSRMYQPTQLADGKTHPYGYGWVIGDWQGRKVLGHGGGIFGFNTSISRYVDDRLAVIVLANTEGSEPQKLDRAIAARVLGVAAKPSTTPATTTTPAKTAP